MGSAVYSSAPLRLPSTRKTSMSLQSRLEQDMKAAMKSGAKADLEVLRMLLSDVKNAAIAEGLERSGVDDGLVLKVLRRAVKTRLESAETYASAGRKDLEERERHQIMVVERYLPSEMSDAELAALVDVVATEQGAQDKKAMGAVMKEVLQRAEGRVDGKRASAAVARRLG